MVNKIIWSVLLIMMLMCLAAALISAPNPIELIKFALAFVMAIMCVINIFEENV